MKILAIRGRNLASLEGDFEIDFTVEPLLSAGIFAISGPTGAGKSTLLDTMCLALFARTPRTDQAKKIMSSFRMSVMNNCRRAILVSCCGGEHPPVLQKWISWP